MKQLIQLFHSYTYILKKYRLFGNRICIDLSTLCQLTCKGCHHPNNMQGYCKGVLPLEQFESFFEKNPGFSLCEIANRGEVFLNPELKKILAYAHQNKIDITIKTGVNFNTVSESQLKALVKYKVTAMTIGIDGACNDTYTQEILKR